MRLAAVSPFRLDLRQLPGWARLRMHLPARLHGQTLRPGSDDERHHHHLHWFHHCYHRLSRHPPPYVSRHQNPHFTFSFLNLITSRLPFLYLFSLSSSPWKGKALTCVLEVTLNLGGILLFYTCLSPSDFSWYWGRQLKFRFSSVQLWCWFTWCTAVEGNRRFVTPVPMTTSVKTSSITKMKAAAKMTWRPTISLRSKFPSAAMDWDSATTPWKEAKFHVSFLITIF